MPEGDTLRRTAEVLRAVLAGQEVRAARGRPGGPRLELLVGRTVERVEARGKHLLIEVSGGLTLHTHLGMHGSWHRYRAGEAWRRRARDAVAVLETPGAEAVCFAAPTVELVETRALAMHPVLSRLGPDLLDPGPDLDEVLRRQRAPERAGVAVGDVLLDQFAQAGIGNVYRSEVCFVERVDPFAAVSTLDDETLRRLVETARRLLAANTGGPFRATLEDGSGGGSGGSRGSNDSGGSGARPASFAAPRPRGERLWVYGRAGRPCRRCGALIRSRATGALARRVYWCPACQPPRARPHGSGEAEEGP
jgi:endonuclease-8